MQGDGWWILGIRDPARMTPLASIPAGARESAHGATTEGIYAYLAAGPGGMHVLDVSDPAQPRRIGSFNTRGFATRVAVSGNLLCVADGTPALTVIDVSDPSNPVRRGELDDGAA